MKIHWARLCPMPTKKKKGRAFFCPSVQVRIFFWPAPPSSPSFLFFFLLKRKSFFLLLPSISEISFWAPPPSTALFPLNTSKSFLLDHIWWGQKDSYPSFFIFFLVASYCLLFLISFSPFFFFSSLFFKSLLLNNKTPRVNAKFPETNLVFWRI